jgi:hypothetical protein
MTSGLPYTDGHFLYPPRAEHKIKPESLKDFDNGTYFAQIKSNGSACSVAISDKGDVIVKERHNTFFSVPPKFDFRGLHRGKGWMNLVGEFMNKSKKDEGGAPFRGFIIWDITAFNGELLVGMTVEERVVLLERLYPHCKEKITPEGIKFYDYLCFTEVPDIYKVVNYQRDFVNLFNKLTKIDMVEGFVLKRRNAKLDMMMGEKNNNLWQVKCRKASASYRF